MSVHSSQPRLYQACGVGLTMLVVVCVYSVNNGHMLTRGFDAFARDARDQILGSVKGEWEGLVNRYKDVLRDITKRLNKRNKNHPDVVRGVNDFSAQAISCVTGSSGGCARVRVRVETESRCVCAHAVQCRGGQAERRRRRSLRQELLGARVATNSASEEPRHRPGARVRSYNHCSLPCRPLPPRAHSHVTVAPQLPRAHAVGEGAVRAGPAPHSRRAGEAVPQGARTEVSGRAPRVGGFPAAAHRRR